MFAALWLLALAPAPTGGDTPPPKPAKAPQQERESLEQFLARARTQQEALQKRLAGEVTALVSQLEVSQNSPAAASLNELDEKIVALGTDATPLLVRYLDVGEDGVDKERLRAVHVAAALSKMDTSAITGELLRMLNSGAPEGKRNALRVLERTKEQARVRPAVEALFKTAEGTLKQSCLRTLVALGGNVKELLAEVLKSSDENLTAMALTTMAETRNADAADMVRSVLFDSRRAGAHALALVDYFKAVPEYAGDKEVLAFVAIANGTASADTRVSVVEALPSFKPRLSSELRRAMEPLVTSSDRRMSEAALVALANCGDKNAKKKLLESYDDRVKQNEEWSQAWVDRGDIYMRIGDHEAAIKDYVKAIQLGNDDRALKPDTYIKLARCYMRVNKVKEAGTYVERAPISMAQRKALSEDPEFKPLRDSKWGKEAFGLE